MKYNKFYVVFKMLSGETYEGDVELSKFLTRDEFHLELMKQVDEKHTIILGYNTILKLTTVESLRVKIIMDAEQKEVESNG